MAQPSPASELDHLFAQPPPPYQFNNQSGDPDEYGVRAVRAVAMAGDLGVDPAQANVLTWIGGMITAGLGAFGVWLASRMLGKAAFQTAINDGFNKLTDNLQEQLAAERLLSVAESARWLARLELSEGRLRNAEQTIVSLKNELRRHGIPIPPDTAPPLPGAAIIPPETTP